MKAFVAVMDACRRFARRRPVPFVCINIILVILWVLVIMSFSDENAYISGGRSARLLVGLVNIFNPSADITLENYDSIEALDNCEKVIRKLAHMFEYGILSALVWSALFGIPRFERRFANIIPVVFAGLIVIIDEKNQTSVEGRYGSWFDVCVDMLGAVIALFVIYHLIRRYRALKREMNSRRGARNVS